MPQKIEIDSENAEVFEFQVKTEEGESVTRVYKRIPDDSLIFQHYPGKTLTEKASNMKRFFSVIKEHMGEVVLDTEFIVAEGEEGNPSIYMVQDKVDGYDLRTIRNHRLYDDFTRKYKTQLQYRLEAALEDERIEDLKEAREWVKKDALNAPQNVMITKDGKIRLIDVV